MVDIVVTSTVSAFLGLLGAVVWWILPPSPKLPVEVAKRLVAGAIVGFMWFAGFGTSPFDAAGNWDGRNVIQLFTSGFLGLSALGAILPKHFNARTYMRKN